MYCLGNSTEMVLGNEGDACGPGMYYLMNPLNELLANILPAGDYDTIHVYPGVNEDGDDPKAGCGTL